MAIQFGKVLVICLAMGAGACSSIVDGTSQEIVVNTNPSGARCILYRTEATIGSVDPTPGAITVKKTKDDITIVCDKDGYQQTTYMNESGVAEATLGNIVLGGGIGWIIDSASGADNKYTSPVNVNLIPVVPAPAPTAAQPAPAAEPLTQ